MKLYTSLLASRYPGYIPHEGDLLSTGKEIIYNGILYKCLVPHTYEGVLNESYFDQISIIKDDFRSGEEWVSVSSKVFVDAIKTLTIVVEFPTSHFNSVVDIIVYDKSNYEVLATNFNTPRKSEYELVSDLLESYTSVDELEVIARIKQTHDYSPKLNTPTVSSIEFYLKSTKMLIKLSNHNFKSRYYKVDIRDAEGNHTVLKDLTYDEDLGGILVPTTHDIVQSGASLIVKVQAYQ